MSEHQNTCFKNAAMVRKPRFVGASRNSLEGETWSSATTRATCGSTLWLPVFTRSDLAVRDGLLSRAQLRSMRLEHLPRYQTRYFRAITATTKILRVTRLRFSFLLDRDAAFTVPAEPAAAGSGTSACG